MLSILIIIPYDNIYPPKNGGMQRCFNVLHQLTRYCKVTAIINQDRDEFLRAIEKYPAFISANIYSTRDVLEPSDIIKWLPSRIKNAIRYRWYKRTLRDTTDSNFLLYYPLLKQLLNQNEFQAVVLENLDSINAAGVIRRYNKKIKILYDAHNVDSNLAKAAYEKAEIKFDMVTRITKVERGLWKQIDAIWACSENDCRELLLMNDNKLLGKVIPNGVNAPNGLIDDGVRLEIASHILFCGTMSSKPNTEGLEWFYKWIWPEIKKVIPFLKLIVVGSGIPPVSLNDLVQDDDVWFSGSVEDVEPWYNKASVAVVPLLTGSGTRLKILEAMAFGIPVISTSKGAEGIDYSDGNNIIIADTIEKFKVDIIELVNNKNKRIILQQNARKLIDEQYTWDVIGKEISVFFTKTEMEAIS